MQSVVQKPMRTIKWIFSIFQKVYTLSRAMRGSRGGTGGPDFIAILEWSNPLKSSEQPSQHSTLGHHRHASETPLKGFSLAGRWWPALSDIWILSPFKKKKKRCQSSDQDQIRMEIRKECFVNLNIWECDSIQSINTVEYPTLSCKSRCAPFVCKR